ncbi:MAG: hypothetical protein HZA03_01910 [Nitrospinae bacterium]|nr:hypothetical protein [Nitrospinota bacterium]
MKTLLAIAVALSCIGGDAAAGVMAQCVDDASRFCSNVKQKNVYTCLRKHASQLSFGCADAMGQGAGGPSGASCQNDALRLCKSGKLNKGTRRCLERNFDQLTPNCQAYFYHLGWVR